MPRPAIAIVADYGSYRLFRGDPALAPAGAWVLDSASLLKFDRLRIDTENPAIAVPAGFEDAAPTGAALQLVQFAGPIKDAWLEQIRAAGAVPIQYIDSNGYLLWADAAARTRLAEMARAGNPLQIQQTVAGVHQARQFAVRTLAAGSRWRSGDSGHRATLSPWR